MILLTGAAGYLGSHIFHEFKKRQIQLIGIDNFSTKNVTNKYSKYILRIDIDNNLKLEKIIKKNIKIYFFNKMVVGIFHISMMLKVSKINLSLIVTI